MRHKLLQFTGVSLLAITCQLAYAATYYISPAGDDASDGQSQTKPWKTCEKVNQTKFAPGDQILFQRGGQWREHLQPDSDGVAGSPITFDTYGTGDKPRLFGSDILDNSRFTPAGVNQYSYPLPEQADSALVDHVFLPSTWKVGTLTLTTTSDPRTDKKLYTACLRGNVIFSNGKNHLVFRNLIVDETAGHLLEGPNQGYGVRIEGSDDVLVESCEAYRCGRHHFAAINSTHFVGRHLIAAYVVPKMPGDNTAYVSYADQGAHVAKCIHEWNDITADHLEDGKGGTNLMFVSHGDNQGLITITRAVARSKMSFMTAPVVIKHSMLKGNASIENFGASAVIDGITLLDSSAIDQWGSDGIIQNCLAHLNPSGGGPTGYGAAIVCRDKANNNVIRFNTLVTGKFSCVELVGEKSVTQIYGNIFIADGNTLAKGPSPLQHSDIAMANFNFYGPAATFSGKTFNQWQTDGFDRDSRVGQPQFTNLAANDLTLKPTSPIRQAVKIDIDKLPADFSENPRFGRACIPGANEK